MLNKFSMLQKTSGQNSGFFFHSFLVFLVQEINSPSLGGTIRMIINEIIRLHFLMWVYVLISKESNWKIKHKKTLNMSYVWCPLVDFWAELTWIYA